MTLGVREFFCKSSRDDLSVTCYEFVVNKNTLMWLLLLGNFGRKVYKIPMVPFINATIQTVGQKMFNQSTCWKKSQEISHAWVNQHSILREVHVQMFSFSWQLFSFSGVSLASVCVCEAETGKASQKKNWHVWYIMIELCRTALPKKKKLIFFTVSRKK